MTDQTEQFDETEGNAEGWRPEPGDQIVGKVVDIAATDGGYGMYPIVTLRTAEGEVAVHAFHQVLRTELAKRRPQVGDEVDITYVGKRAPKSGNGNSFHVYRVKGGQERAFNWDSELPDADRESFSAPPIEPNPVPQGPVPGVGVGAEPQSAPAADRWGADPPF